MHGSRSSVSMYRNTALDTAQQLSSQRQLVLLLSGLVERLRLADQLLREGDIPAKARAISSAFPILEALRGSLDFSVGGELPERLAQIYDTASVWLADVNARNDAEKLQRVIQLLLPVVEAFSALPDEAAPSP